MKRVVLLVAAVLVLVGAVVAWQFAGQHEAVHTSSARQVAQAQAPAGDRPALSDPTSAGASYAFDYAFAMTAPFAGSSDAELTLHVRGTLDLATPRPDKGAAWVPARLRAVTVERNDLATRVFDLSKLKPEADFAAEFAFHVAEDGRVDDVRLTEGQPFAARSALAATAWAAQRARPTPPETSAWDVQERDANGEYSAHYRAHADGSLDKTWTIGQGGDPPERLAQISTGRAHFALTDGVLQALEYDLRGKAATATLNVATFKPFSVHLSLERVGEADERWAASLRPDKLVAWRPGAVKRHKAEEETRRYEDVVADASARSGKMDPGTHAKLRAEWTHLIARQPEALARTEQQLRTGALPEDARRLAVEAMVGARTPQAQDRVTAMVSDDAVPEALRADLLTAAALMSGPTLAFVVGLEKLAFDPVRGQIGALAATTLGASAGFLAETHPAESAKVVQRLVDNARPVLDPPAHATKQPLAVRQAWLAGLGNTGDAQALPLILAALADPSEMLRAQAALSLRRQDPAACVGPMTERMAQDKSVHVRENLVDAARFLGPDKLLPLVEKALMFDASVHVRLAAAYTVTVWSTQAPGLRKVLAEALKREKSPKVAEALQNDLTQGRLAGEPVVAPVQMGQGGQTGKAP